MSTLVFSHANSYPAGCYRLIFDAWRAAGHQVHALEKYGHDPQHPVSSNWPHLVSQLLRYVDEVVQPREPVYLVGHSLGGLLSLMGAARRPQQVRGVLMLDSPYIRGWRAGFVAFGKLSGRIHKQPPASIAQERRQHWPDRLTLEAHFRSKALFRAWDPRVLQDYLDCGFEPDPERGGLRLAFRREVEAAVYATLPHALTRATRGLRVPRAFIAGTHSREMRMGGIEATRRFVGPLFREIEGTHLFPFEHPEATAALALQLLDQLAEQPKTAG
ncbi:alpha/beta hydrolase [Inhella sp.]|uniref:alpha/beta hydrolase n=1 Tax=Inhella sp. TaxID=1921806 RepID=UPI0035B24F13